MTPGEENNKIKKPTIVSPQEWEAARQKLLVKEKELTRARAQWPPNGAPAVVAL